MTLLQFTKELLSFHAQTLSLLEELLDAELAIYLLEKHTENSDPPILPHQEFFEPCETQSILTESDCFEEISNHVESLNLNLELKFYLWSYPLYRAIIEDSTGNFSQTFKKNDPKLLQEFIGAVKHNLEAWAHDIQLSSELQKKFMDHYHENIRKFLIHLQTLLLSKPHLTLL